ncbi:MAG: 4-(cytidine 5'-diphospho)-2-C-methyl-D-erythritol kinase [Bacteroidales bacterium]
MVVFPKAKINLGLTISGKRPDGYHDIETIFYPVPFCDAMEMVVRGEGAKHDCFMLTGIDLPCKIEENLVLRAVKRLREAFTIPELKIHLHKAVPSGAGLGGGSSDAACMLCTLNKYFGFSLSQDELKTFALGLGSDCPFFIMNKPAYATGRGEILEPVDNILECFKILLLNPGIQVNTREAYEDCKPSGSDVSLTEIIKLPVSEWKELMINDFEKTVFTKFPAIGRLKERLYESGALYSSMSGSGSTVYGIFKEEPIVPEDVKKFLIYNGEL